MSWATEKVKQLEEKGKANWDSDDLESYYYCQECFAEDERDAEYLGNYDVYIPSAENGDYSPSNPWDAPGCKISDFI